MKEETFNIIYKISKITLVLSIAGLLFMVGYGYGNGTLKPRFMYALSSDLTCNNSTNFQEAVKCLNANFSSWFVYNISQISKTLNETELYSQGGVCSQASEWYVDKIESLGYKAKTIVIAGDSSSHEFAVAWNRELTEYCIIDQVTIKCARIA